MLPSIALVLYQVLRAIVTVQFVIVLLIIISTTIIIDEETVVVHFPSLLVTSGMSRLHGLIITETAAQLCWFKRRRSNRLQDQVLHVVLLPHCCHLTNTMAAAGWSECMLWCQYLLVLQVTQQGKNNNNSENFVSKKESNLDTSAHNCTEQCSCYSSSSHCDAAV